MNTNPYPMGAYPPPPQPMRRRSPLAVWALRLTLLGATGVIMLFLLAALYLAFHQLQFKRLIYPGVSAYGTDLGGMTREQAIATLSQRFTYGTSAVFTFRDGERVWQQTAADLGVSFDPAKTVDAAYEIGRGSGGIVANLMAQGEAWLNGRAIQPVVVFDESRAEAFLRQISTEIDRPMLDATLSVQGTVITTTPSQVGRTLDVRATLGLLRQVILNLTTGAEIPLIVRETPPSVLSVEETAAKLRTAIASAIQLYIETPKDGDPGPWQASPDFIAGLFTVERVANGDGTARYELRTNLDALRAFLTELSPALTVEARNARMLFDENSRTLQVIKDSVNGRALDVEATVKRFEGVLYAPGQRRVALAFREVIPTVNSLSKAEELGITQKIVETTTFFYGSTEERRTNIQVAASKFHGLVISPGEEFSFNKYLGDVSPESGYETGLVIYGDRTIQGVGGGVCQVSTTIFQAAFFGAFPITERYAHGYRVGYYESGVTYANGQKYQGGVGMDATVYSPIIDFKFKNDTPYHLLIEVTFTPAKQQLTMRFYSTPSGRVVEKAGPKLTNVVPHGPPKYTESPNIRPGETRQVDYAVDGVDVRVWRTVRDANGAIIINNEEFYSHYLPWSAQFLVAPGYAPKR